jgi:hypothetical protein
MLSLLRLLFGLILCLFGSRGHLILENIALRQQVTALRRRSRRPRLTQLDRLFWVTLRSLWSNWKDSLIIVTPDTVVRWHRAGFRLYWRWISKPNRVLGRKPTTKELRQLVLQMAAENPSWGAPRIHGELLKLGFDVSERTISRLLRHAPRRPEAAKQWKAFLKNHREPIVAMDFFTVPTLTFGILIGEWTAMPQNALRFELLGQRDDVNIITLAWTQMMWNVLARRSPYQRVSDLAQYLKAKLAEPRDRWPLITPKGPERSWGVVRVSAPQGTRTKSLYDWLYENKRIAGSGNKETFRLCPHIYNTLEDVNRAVDGMNAWYGSS